MIDLAIDNRVIIQDELDEAIQELDLLLNTENTELIGDTNFGVSLDQFLWTLTPTTKAFEQYIKEKLSTLYYLNKFEYSVNVDFLEGEYRSIYHLKIYIFLDENRKIKKEYEFR